MSFSLPQIGGSRDFYFIALQIFFFFVIPFSRVYMMNKQTSERASKRLNELSDGRAVIFQTNKRRDARLGELFFTIRQSEEKIDYHMEFFFPFFFFLFWVGGFAVLDLLFSLSLCPR
ncbi:hypothetical protein V8C37DRAFT_313416 [Trichoderma ceciliae]